MLTAPLVGCVACKPGGCKIDFSGIGFKMVVGK